MKGHLSEEQLSEWISGTVGSDVRRHLETCAICRREAEGLKQALGGFRDSIRATAEAYKAPWRAPAQSERPAWRRFMAQRWAYAVVMAAILVVSVILLRVDHRRASRSTAGTLGENEILMQVQADVDQTVPGALAPGELLLAGAEEAPPAPAKTVRGTGKSHRR